MLKTTCPFCQSTDVRRSSRHRAQSERQHDVRARYRCRDCGRTFRGNNRIGVYLVLGTMVAALVIGVGSLGLHALEQSSAEAQRVADALQVNELVERANRGDPVAEYELYRRYAKGLDTSVPSQRAHELLKRSAEHGHADAQYDLATALIEGVGVVQDYSQALKWMRSAAAGGNWLAHHSLGLMYRDGLGTAPDPVKAYIHFNVAAARGSPDAVTMRNAVMSQLSPGQIIDAQAEARKIVEGRNAEMGDEKIAGKGVGKTEALIESGVDRKK